MRATRPEMTDSTVGTIERRLATILCADVANYSKMMAADEERTVRVFRGHREIFESLVVLHRGRIFNTAGDALLVEFNSPVEAVRCATEIQAALRTRNEHLGPDEKMQFRMGINVGDVIIQGGDLLGDGVNVAARIQTATAPGGICISGSVYDQIQNKLSLDFNPLGEQTYKNIAKPVRTYTISEGAAVTAPARSTRLLPLAAITAAVLAGAGYWGYQRYEVHRAEQLRLDARLAAEVAKREAHLQAQKLEERTQLERERERFEAERQAVAAAKRRAESSQRPAATATKDVPKLAASHDGSYSGQLCSETPTPLCWSVPLLLRNGVAEGSWISSTQQQTATASGAVAPDGSVRLNLATWHPKDGTRVEAVLLGRIVEGAITASGEWSRGGRVVGEWKRAP